MTRPHHIAACLILTCTFLVPTAAFAALPTGTPVTAPPSAGGAPVVSLTNIPTYVGRTVTTQISGATFTVTWYRGATADTATTVIATGVSHTPGPADRGQHLRRVIAFTYNGNVMSRIDQRFTLAVQ